MPFTNEKLSVDDWKKYKNQHKSICESAEKEFERVYVAKVVAAKYDHYAHSFNIVTLHVNDDKQQKQTHLSVEYGWLKRFIEHSEVHDLLITENANCLFTTEGYLDISRYKIPVYFSRGHIN